jgi:hypothetical protein
VFGVESQPAEFVSEVSALLVQLLLLEDIGFYDAV